MNATLILAAGPSAGPSNALVWLQIILLFMAGILAISGLIVAKKPDAQQIIDKLVPFQALIGVGLMAVGIILLIQVGPIDTFKAAGMGLQGMAVFGVVVVGIVLGFLFGMPQVAKWLPGQSSAEAKAMELAQKLAAFQVLIGLVGLAAAVIALLYQLGLLKTLNSL